VSSKEPSPTVLSTPHPARTWNHDKAYAPVSTVAPEMRLTLVSSPVAIAAFSWTKSVSRASAAAGTPVSCVGARPGGPHFSPTKALCKRTENLSTKSGCRRPRPFRHGQDHFDQYIDVHYWVKGHSV